MTHLTQYDDGPPFAERGRYGEFHAIAAALAPSGVVLERWHAGAILPEEPSDEAILSGYAADIERLKARGGYRSCDVLRVMPDHPDRANLRTKFLDEHIHDDDEVRFFVEGSGLFYIRAGGIVHALECTAGDLIVLPAGTAHWFDTGERPRFTVIRLFITPEGWIARYTGDEIARSIPLYEGAL
jgi:1,2-dihydroxy-3-keto-5-methylthiopentene dioxygenase